MKRIMILFSIIILWTSTGTSQHRSGSSYRTQSYFGFSGLTFIPTAQTLTPNQINMSYSSKPCVGSDLSLNPFSIRFGYGATKAGLEITSTNTVMYASNLEYGGVSLQNYGLPFIPSIKYQFMPMTRENYYVAMAAGFSMPYGAYYVVDKFLDVKLFDITVHSGVATKLTTYHAFAGATFTFGNRIGETQRDFPFEMILEGSWGGNLKQLDEKEEAFAALSFRQAWTSSLSIVTFFRFDNQPYFDENDQKLHNSPTKQMGIGLDLNLGMDIKITNLLN